MTIDQVSPEEASLEIQVYSCDNEISEAFEVAGYKNVRHFFRGSGVSQVKVEGRETLVGFKAITDKYPFVREWAFRNQPK